MRKPLCIELYAGRFGWGRGFVAEGSQVIGFDIEHLPHHGPVPEGCELVLQDVLTLHGSQFKDAACLVASPPCQRYSYMSMPWSRAKREIRWQEWRRTSPFSPGFDLNDLFDACFRIQREASEAAGHHIPMVVENVCGAQRWVGPARARFGSYFLWGDVDSVGGRIVAGRLRFGQTLRAARRSKNNGAGTWFAIGSPGQTQHNGNPVNGMKQPGRNFHFYEKTGLPSPSFHGAEHEASVPRYVSMTNGGQKGAEAAWFNDHKKNGVAIENGDRLSYTSSCSQARKAASAMIAEIPFDLARYIASAYRP
jgi:hypothetical protein